RRCLPGETVLRPGGAVLARHRARAQRFDTERMGMSETVLVTGASRGIGRAIALRAAQDGYDVVVHCRSRRDAAEAVAAEITALGRRSRVLQFDVADRAACAQALAADVAEHG